MKNAVTLIIPCVPEYVSVVRLTILGVASRLGFSYDAVEDVRLAVAEACTNAIARSHEWEAASEEGRISIRTYSDDSRLTIEVSDNIPNTPTQEEVDEVDFEEEGLGIMLMELCMDEVFTEETPEGTRVRLIKKNDRPMAL